MFKVEIEGCIGCGACTGICPEVFDLNDQGLAENIIGDIPDELEDSVTQAMECCPVEAIDKV